MAFFRSKKSADDESAAAKPLEPGATGAAEVADSASASVPAVPSVEPEPAAARVVPRPQGPWDSSDLPAEDDRERLDLGGLLIYVPEDVELRVDLDQNSQVVAATLVHEEELMQLGVFAAPRTEPIWDEVRAEIAESVTGGGGSVNEVEGPFGTELRARVPTDQPGVFAPARFLGVNGPRWFLRALISGPRSADGVDDPVLMDALRAVVVARGGEAMAPRDGLALRLPKDAQASAEAAIAEAQGTAQATDVEPVETGRTTLPPPERGPETTETR